MKFTVVLILALCWNFALAQQTDSPLVQNYRHVTDSLESLTSKQWNTDSLKVFTWSDTLKTKVLARFNRDSLKLVNKIDSLKQLGSFPDHYLHKMDSLVQKKDALIGEVNSKQQELISKTKSKLEEWRSKVSSKLGVDQLSKVQGVDLPDTNIPDLNGINLPENGLGNLDLPEMPQLNIPEIENLNLSTDLTSLNKSFSLDQLDGLTGLQDKLGVAGESLSKVSEMTKDPTAALEQSFTEIKDVKAVTESFKEAEALKNNEYLQQAEMLKDPEALKQEVKEQVMQRAVNHFAGKEQVLQQAMDKMAWYKAKYESLNSLSGIKKLPRNAMHGKPFRERLIPGVAFQFQKNSDDLFLDINPYVGYRITGRVISGFGWNQRIGYSKKYDWFTSASVVYGPRLYTEVRIWRGFSSRIEAEWMNTAVPNLFNKSSFDPNQREWVFTPLMGIKKEYRFLKNIKGTVLLMFNLYNPLHKSPYGDLIYSRFGFEFQLKKGKAKVKV